MDLIDNGSEICKFADYFWNFSRTYTNYKKMYNHDIFLKNVAQGISQFKNKNYNPYSNINNNNENRLLRKRTAKTIPAKLIIKSD